MNRFPDPRTPHGSRPFRLTKYHAVSSLIGIAIVAPCLLWSYLDLTERQLIDHESRANADHARAFGNALWSRYAGFVLTSAGRSREALLADPTQPRIREDVLARMRGLQIVEIRIHNLDGLTAFSTDVQQIGEDKSSDHGFQRARTGGVASQLTDRGKADGFAGTSNNRLIVSYVPIRAEPEGTVEGVLELHSDITELLHQQTETRWQMAGTILALLGALYLYLFLIVRKADRVIARQEQESAANREQFRYQAYHDALTGLPNRAYFAERLGETLSLAARHHHSCALMFIDLDRFKIVNDSFGHQAGDELLMVVAERIHSCLRDSDRLFRMGGDEFTIILPEIATPEDAAFVARRILEAMISPVSIDENELAVGATIGIAVYPGDGDNAGALLKNADAAMYVAKQNGRGTHAFFRTEMNQRVLQRQALEAALQQGFRNGEFTLYYQPRLDAATRQAVAVEALLRWSSPQRGLVPFSEISGVLQEMGMMPLVDEWVLRSACTQACRWHGEGMEMRCVSVNVSSTLFRSGSLPALVARVLRDTGTAPELIELEVTESLLRLDVEQAYATIAALKGLGLRISIDDFGAGYSSLNHLRHVAVDYLKIHRSFVAEISSNARDRAVVTAIIELAHALNVAVIAKGVETEAQATFFSSVHCSELQGSLFCSPLPEDQLRLFLASTVEVRHPNRKNRRDPVVDLWHTTD